MTEIKMPKFLSKLPGVRGFSVDLKPSIYFLVQAGRIVYIGRSNNPLSRLRDHRNDKLKKFDSIFFWEIESQKDLNKLESVLIRIARPYYNAYFSPRRPVTTVPRKEQRALLAKYCPLVLADVEAKCDPDSVQYGPVEVIAGPYEGLEGYYDDDDCEVARQCAYCRSSKVTERCKCKYELRAIVYLSEWTTGDYLLMPPAWLKSTENEKVVGWLFPSFTAEERKLAVETHDIMTPLRMRMGMAAIVEDMNEAQWETPTNG